MSSSADRRAAGTPGTDPRSPPASPAHSGPPAADGRSARTSLVLSWADIEEACRELVQGLGDRSRFQGVVAISRGGMVPAGLVVRLLDTRYVDALSIAAYEDRLRGEPRLIKGIQGDGSGMLVVDDVADTGVTLELVRRLLPRAHIAALYVKPAGRAFVDSHARAVSQDTWIVFPWEQFETAGR